MISEEDWHSLQQEKMALQEQLAQRDAQIAQMHQQIVALSEQVQTLQEQLKKNSRNSSLPPSSDRFTRQKRTRSLRQRSGKQPGAQPGHEGHTLEISTSPDQIIVHEVLVCAHCHHDLHQEPALRVERRQVVDVPPTRLIVTEHQAEAKCCPSCHQVSLSPFPEGVTTAVQYGPAIGAMAVYLVEQQLLPHARACETMHDLLGVSMAAGTLTSLIERCAQQLEPVEARIKDALRSGAVLHQDESSLYVMGQRWWTHVSCTATLTHDAAHPKRGSEALDAIGIISGFLGISVHDSWVSSWRYPCSHALCNVHHLRELTFLHEVQKQAWAGKMKQALQAMLVAVTEAKARGETSLSAEEIARWKASYQAIVQEGEEAHPRPPGQDPNAPPPCKGRRPKQSPARNLLDRLITYQDAILTFLSNFAVPFDNSQAERDVRMVKVQQKVSGSFRSEAGAHAFCRIRGYLSTDAANKADIC